MIKFSAADGVGILWHNEDGYPAFLAAMADARVLPRSFKDWERRANEAVLLVESQGGRVVRVDFNINKFRNYCLTKNIRFDANGRNRFAADPANWPSIYKN